MKKVFLSITLVIAVWIGSMFIYDSLPMYIKNEAIFKGYSDYDGREYIGIDADIYYVFITMKQISKNLLKAVYIKRLIMQKISAS